VFGIVSIFGGLLALTLPETNKRPLPQTIEDIDNWYKPTVGLQQQSAENASKKDDPFVKRGIIINSINIQIISAKEQSSLSDQMEGTLTTVTPFSSLENLDDDTTLTSSVYL